MRHVYQTTGQVTGVGRLHGGIGKTLTGTVGRDEVLQHRHTLLEVRQNWVLNNLVSFGTCLLRLSHQTTDTRKLFDLVLTTTGTRVQHHEYGVEALVGLSHLLQQDVTDIIVDVRPGIDDLIITLIVGNESHVIVVGNLTYLLITFLDQISLLLRDDNVIEVERQTCQICHTITKVLDTIEELASLSKANVLDHIGDNVAQALLGDDGIHETNLLRNDAVDDDTTYGCLDHVALGVAVNDIVDNHLHQCVKITFALIMGDDSLFGTIEGQAFTLGTRTNLGDIIETKHHIL